MNTIYHVMLGKRRTTVSLDNILSDMLSIKLGHMPETPDAHAAVRQWLQERIDADGDANRTSVSQWLQGKLIESLVPNDLSKAYSDWRILRWSSDKEDAKRYLTGTLDKFLSEKVE